jgi:hypothetical protein
MFAPLEKPTATCYDLHEGPPEYPAAVEVVRRLHEAERALAQRQPEAGTPER